MTGRIQNEDVKSEAELIAGGATKASLPASTKMYLADFGLNKRFDEAIANMDLGDGDAPVRMYAANTPDAKLYFRASRLQVLDGSSKVSGILDDALPNFVASTINWQTGTITGGSFTYQGSSFSFPSTTVGQHRRFAFALQSDGTMAVNYSAAFAAVASLPDPGTLFSALEGQQVGYIDLEATAATAFKTSGSSTSVIEGKVGGVSRIWRFGSGAGGSGGADKTLKIISVSGTSATLKGGYLEVDSVGVLGSGSGSAPTTVGVNITVSLSTILTASGLVFAADTLYTLVIDLFALSAAVNLSPDDNRYVYVIGESQLKLFVASDPTQINPLRYVWIDQIKTAVASTDFTAAKTYQRPGKHHNPYLSFFKDFDVAEITITTAVATTYTNELGILPSVIYAYYYNGTTTIPVNPATIVTNVIATTITIDSTGLTFGSGKYLKLFLGVASKFDSIASQSKDFESAWLSSTGTTTVPHEFGNRDEIKGISVHIWDVAGATVSQVIDPSSLVLNWDDTNLNLDWNGLTPQPSSTFKYRICASRSALPWTIPAGYGGYTRFVGRHPNSYGTITAALAASAAGDSILVMRDYTISATETVALNDIRIKAMPGVTITVNGTTRALRVTGSRCEIDLNYLASQSGTLADLIQLEGDDNRLHAYVNINHSAFTITDVFKAISGADRNRVTGSILVTVGAKTNNSSDAGTNNSFSILG